MIAPDVQEPRHLTQLQARIRNRSRALGRGEGVLERLIANVVVGQMLPPGMMKGGTALKVRIRDTPTRFSRDLDANLGAGWHGFTATERQGRPVQAPLNVPDDRWNPPCHTRRPIHHAVDTDEGDRLDPRDTELRNRHGPRVRVG